METIVGSKGWITLLESEDVPKGEVWFISIDLDKAKLDKIINVNELSEFFDYGQS